MKPIQTNPSYFVPLLLALLLFPWPLLGQGEGGDFLWKVLKAHEVDHFEDPSRAMAFPEVREGEFTREQAPDPNVQAVHWYRFSLSNPQRKKLLALHFRLTERSDVHVPVKAPEGYKRYVVGTFAQRTEPLLVEEQSHVLTLETEGVDFDRPFYFNKTAVTQWAKLNWMFLPGYSLLDGEGPVREYLLQVQYGQRDLTFYIGIVFISFFLFLVNFAISGNRSYLIYGLYLLGVALYYGNRQAFAMNLYNGILPELNFYINQVAHIANMGCYIWFVSNFLDFKHHFPKVHSFTRGLLIGILVFGLLHLLQILLFPFFPYRHLGLDLFRTTVMLLSVGLFLYLMFQKTDAIAKFVLVGSLLLIAGNVLSLILVDYTLFLRLMVVEIILFSIVVALKNKQLDDRRTKVRYELQVEKMKLKTLEELDATKSHFYENITHEFRSPLTLILSPIERKLAEGGLPPGEKKELDLIRRNAQRLLELINQMLDLAKLEADHIKLAPRQGDLHAALLPLVETYRVAAGERNIDFYQNIQKTGTVLFDREVVEKVTSNLLSNALKYTVEKGSIHFESYTKNGYWVLVVTNSIDRETPLEISKLFTRYYRARGGDQGAGVGLNITKELVELADGNILVNTLPGDRIQFTVSLPLDPSDQGRGVDAEPLGEAGPEPTQDPAPLPFPREGMGDPPAPLAKLLIVEDSVDMRAFIASNFNQGYQILEAENGKVGLEKAVEHLPNLIISDVMMPVLDGFGLCDGIKQNPLTSHIPIILLTAKVGEENETKGFRTGADAYMTKPFSTEKLKIRVKQLLEAQKRIADHYRKTFSIDPKLAITDTESTFLGDLKTVLDEHITEAGFDSGAFGRAMNMSTRQLHRKLKAIIGMTPMEFVRNERLRLGAELLKKSDVTVAEIAYQVGFNTPSYFIKCFKELYGQTPMAMGKKS